MNIAWLVALSLLYIQAPSVLNDCASHKRDGGDLREIHRTYFSTSQRTAASHQSERKNGTTQFFAELIKYAYYGWSLAYGFPI